MKTQIGYGVEKTPLEINIELRLDKEYGYVLNVVQGDYEIIDYEIEGVENAITIIQSGQ